MKGDVISVDVELSLQDIHGSPVMQVAVDSDGISLWMTRTNHDVRISPRVAKMLAEFLLAGVECP